MTSSAPTESNGLRAAVIFFGVLAALTAGGLALFTVGEVASAVVAVALIAVSATVATSTGRRGMRIAAFSFVGLVVVTVAVGLIGLLQILAALAGGSATTAEPPNPAMLASAESKLDGARETNAFQLSLSEDELNAVLQKALDESDNPFKRVTIDITNPVGRRGLIDFSGTFKQGGLSVDGTLGAIVDEGKLDLDLIDVGVGMFSMPGIAKRAVEQMVTDLADLNAALADEGAEIQQMIIGDDRIVVTGTNIGRPIDAADALAAIRRQVDLRGFEVEISEEYEPGDVDGIERDGDVYYVALGDSLAANVGVERPRDGYVSQFLLQLESRDGVEYGLRNFGVSGETSASLLRNGQLQDAVAFGRTHDVAYVTIDIGGNDLLGHLTSADCSEDIDAPPCLDRVNGAIGAYDANVGLIFDQLVEGFPDATLVLLTTYNPFSFGFSDVVTFEARSNDVVRILNEVAGDAAEERGIVVADGFTPMLGTTKGTTHMVDAVPDIHPNEIGYDRLTRALVLAVDGR